MSVKFPLKISGFELPRIISPSAVLKIPTLALNVFPPSLASDKELFFVKEAMLLNVAPFKNKRGLSKVTSPLKIVPASKSKLAEPESSVMLCDVVPVCVNPLKAKSPLLNPSPPMVIVLVSASTDVPPF